MKVKEISAKTEKELEVLITDLRSKVNEAQIEMASRKGTDVKLIKRLKKDLARALTFHRQHQLEKKDA